MDKYKMWIDAYGKEHDITKMETQYIENCLKELKKMTDVWETVICKDLTKKELKLSENVGQKAWYVKYGLGYIEAFTEELAERKTKK